MKSTSDVGSNHVKNANFHPPRKGPYLWPHPYFDNYSDNITKLPGPVYKPAPAAPKRTEAIALIKGLKLDQLKELEKRKQAYKDRISRMQAIAMKCSNTGRPERDALGQRLRSMSDALLQDL